MFSKTRVHGPALLELTEAQLRARLSAGALDVPAVVRGAASAWGAMQAHATQVSEGCCELGGSGLASDWLRRNTPLTEWVQASRIETSFLSSFADGTLSTLHRDYADNLHTVLAGRKAWVLVPAKASARAVKACSPWSERGPQNSERAGFDSLLGDLAAEGAVRVDLDAGDMIYVPRGTWHAVRSVAPGARAVALVYTFFRAEESRLRRASALPWATRAHVALQALRRGATRR